MRSVRGLHFILLFQVLVITAILQGLTNRTEFLADVGNAASYTLIAGVAIELILARKDGKRNANPSTL